MKLSHATKIIAAGALIYWPLAAFSHIVLETRAAPAGSIYKAVLQVGHGCQGAPTTAIAVQIPSGFDGVKPYPKAGWVITMQANTLITWTAASKEAALQNAYFDEFTLRGKLPDASGPLWFKVLQTCSSEAGGASNNWADVPAAGVSTKGLALPAALLEVTAPVPLVAPAVAMPPEHKH